MSLYLNPNNALDRLRREWEKYGSIIVAVDYDSTLIPFMDYEFDHDFTSIRALVRDLKSLGCIIIIFTASDPSRHENIKNTLLELNIEWHLFNESPPHIPNIGRTGKVYANAYLDDRAGLAEVFAHLQQLVTERKLLNSNKKAAELAERLKVL